MELYPLLFSRTFSKDYRWLLKPDFIPADTLVLINKMHDLFDQQGGYKIERERLRPVFVITSATALSIVEFTLFPHEDSGGRQIRGIQGICVNYRQVRSLWYALPLILAERDFYLNAGRELDNKDADQITTSTNASFKLDLNQVSTYFESATELASKKLQLHANKPITLTFSTSGYDLLLSAVSSPYLSLCNIAFGATSKMLSLLPDVGVVAPLFEQSSRVSSLPSIEQNTDSDQPFKRETPSELECEIHLVQKQRLWLGFIPNGLCYCFEVHLVSPSKSDSIMQSDCFDLPDPNIQMQTTSYQVRQAHERLTLALKTQGWQQTPSQSIDPWWRLRFRKRSSVGFRTTYE